MIWIKTIIFSILVPGVVTLFIPYCALKYTNSLDPIVFGVSEIIGIALMGLGLSIYLICVWNFAEIGKGTPAPIAPPHLLISRSLYKYSRNPMYIGIISILVGETLIFRSFILGGYTVLLFICFHLFVRYYEELALSRQFGAEYARYCREVPRWLIHWPSGGRSAQLRHSSKN